ncbi:MAG: glycosyltransferase family 39 protein [Defluviitaleaceae bacterium]|nr:glycosyltransferase family 39 protein [Defluviitaleaceae bacterium]
MQFPKINISKAEIPLLVIFAAALLLRIYWVLNVPTVQLFDFANYQMIAENIANGLGHTMHGSPVAWQGSGYPYVLGIFYRIIGTTDVLAGKWLNIAFSMGTLVFCWLIYKKIFEKRKFALTALAITAFLPQYIAYVNVIGTEVFFTFLLSAIVFVKIYFLPKTPAFFVLGALIGLTALVRPFMMAYPVIAGIYMLSATKQLKRSLAFAGICFAVMVVIITPWAIRNYTHFGRFIPVSYNSGYVLFINNNNENVNGLWMNPLRATADFPDRHAILEQALDGRTIHQAYDVEPYLSAWAREWISQNPVEYLKLGVLRVYRTFFDGANDIPQWAANVSPMYDEGLTEAQRTWHRRNHNFLEASAGIITFILNGTGFLFMFAMVKKYAVGLFTKNGRISLHTAIIFINLAFLIVIPFFFEGQARYAFPAFIFVIPAAVAAIKGFAHEN